MPGLRYLVLCAVLCLVTTVADARKNKKPDPTVVRELHYGDVLFHFYKQDYFTAITRLLAAQEQELLAEHTDEAELLLGGLYLSYGQHDEASRIFQNLLDPAVTPDVRDRVWFFLAKIWYQRGYYNQAEEALAHIGTDLPEEFEPEQRMLEAQVLMAQDRFAEAEQKLTEWKADDDWGAYVRYNLGVALVRQDRAEESARYLDKVGRLNSSDEELLALRDKANLALGYSYIQDGKPELARPVLERVRLEGPYSSKALLGVGWADTATHQYDHALVPWLELNGRNLFDSAVQESLLASPYAYAQLGAFAEATSGYRRAIDTFAAEISRLDESITSIRNGQMVDQILSLQTDNAVGWFFRLDRITEAPETRYLYELMADHQFQEALKNYRDLRYLERNLGHWERSLEAFDIMLETAVLNYHARLPRIEAIYAQLDIASAEDIRDGIAEELLEVERSGNGLKLASEQELALWREVAALEQLLESYDGSDPLTEERDKLGLIKGALYWDIHKDFPQRLWGARKNFRTLHEELIDAQERRERVEELRVAAPDKLEGFAQRIAALSPRIDALHAEVSSIANDQDRYIEYLAVRRLEQQKSRLNAYLVQARFALATIYDRASAELQP